MPQEISFNNPPLVEAIFEIKFKDFKLFNYDLFVGELYSKLKSKYPITETLKDPEIPTFLLPFVIQHRFKSNGENGYPLYQTGPGIISFNIDGTKYKTLGWKGFKKEIKTFLKACKEVIADNFISENIEKITLRYIDIIDDGRMYPNLKDYFSNYLNLGINLNFAEGVDFIEDLEDVLLSQTYKKNNNKIKFTLRTITKGTRKLMLDCKTESTVVPEIENIKDWLEEAHTADEQIFFKLTNNIRDLFN
jgi:uncharacterized protein (TIGR04255 family)